MQQKAPKLFHHQKKKNRLKFPGAYDERATRMVKIFVHLDEPKAKKVARPVHKVVAKDMGQKNKGSPEGIRECVQAKVGNGGGARDWRI